MKKIYIVLGCLILFSACTKHKEEKKTTIIKNENIVAKNIVNDEPVGLNDDCSSDPIETLITEYNGISFYTDNTLRGTGVVQLLVDKNVNILNEDKSIFGSILLSNNELEPYEIKLTKKVIAREVIPDIEHRIFSFDAEQPENDKDFLIIYINGERKLMEKKNNKYKYSSWEEYIKAGFIHLTPKIDNCTKDEQMYYYKVLKIKNDSMQIKSVSKTSCDYVEEYKDVTKWIKWKNDSCKFVMFDFCY
ncbi:hypothetical protein [Flavobacterium johnsoniae]|uniref:Hypothetical lipoprotein n=1 Tax=Flavobacterium johnsoniae (strain ATCC 17061 / DSM 2064 / JCM 8514 / BCRC 14874 / CCUG 350202 / NBRC 14942 / NCIMB 11054 / UW101) TaxID=376686 RepID=A5FET4_FLAJ1|nr:hypothetical protein [Flavobacterium johnsoniae]ABQ06289.1 hypothetical lipoprotein [Flavobacterium johnsoniae UW101]OXE98241.1 hypothetical protein B0A63_14930 [Flavobacterium johnsoniae UW101]WQG82037.1 hypothetical protein SR927_02790 [Flavobacterium johnsoniae UW101]SHK70969.1 hypothetical protein SAMN05444146_2012 [Flavobacterium johnsoniae]